MVYNRGITPCVLLILQVIKFARGDNHVGECSSLVEDIPLGARLLAAMANVNRER